MSTAQKLRKAEAKIAMLQSQSDAHLAELKADSAALRQILLSFDNLPRCATRGRVVERVEHEIRARWDNANALSACIKRADAAEMENNHLRDALAELIESRGGSGKRINSAWANAGKAIKGKASK